MRISDWSSDVCSSDLSAVRAGGSVKRDAVEDRAHRVLADAEVERAAVRLRIPVVCGDGERAERICALDGGVVAAGEVGGAAPQLGQDRSERVERRTGGLASRNALGVGLVGRESVGPVGGELTGEQAVEEFLARSEEHTSELQVTNAHLVCRLLL